MLFSYNKSANNTFSHGLSAKQTKLYTGHQFGEDSSIQQHQQQFDQHSHPNPRTDPPFAPPFFTLLQKNFARHFEMSLGGEQFQPPRLMPRINRYVYFSLTEVVRKNASENRFTEAVLLKSINRCGHYKRPASRNTSIFGGGPLIRPASVKSGRGPLPIKKPKPARYHPLSIYTGT
jgi:hypothetical protein